VLLLGVIFMAEALLTHLSAGRPDQIWSRRADRLPVAGTG
jgi:hypothetical protein